MKKILSILAVPLLAFAQQGPPAWQVPAGDTNTSEFIVVDGGTAQEIIDNLDLVDTNLFTRTGFPNMDTNSLDDITNIVVGTPRTVWNGDINIANGTATLQFPTAVTNVNYITAAVATASVTGPDLSITFPEFSPESLDGTLTLVASATISEDPSGEILPNYATVTRAVWYEISWDAAAERVKYEHPDFTGSLTNGVFTVPAGQAGKYLVSVGAVINTDKDNAASPYLGSTDFLTHYYTGAFAGPANGSVPGYTSADSNIGATGTVGSWIRGAYHSTLFETVVGGFISTAFKIENATDFNDNVEVENLAISIYKVQETP